MREVAVGACCEILADSYLEYATLGDYSYLGQRCIVADATIGKFCAIAAEVRIGAPNHPIDRPAQHRFTYVPEYYSAAATRDRAFFAARRAARVSIGNDVWIGHGVLVLPRGVPPYTIVGGVPARVIRERFPRAVAERLARIARWDWPFAVIMERLAEFQSADIAAICDRWDR